MTNDLGHGRYNLTVDGGCVVSADVEVFNIVLPEGIGFDPLPELPRKFLPVEILVIRDYQSMFFLRGRRPHVTLLTSSQSQVKA